MSFDLEAALRLWLAEDLGPDGLTDWRGDVTGQATLGPDLRCQATLTAGGDGILAGTTVVRRILERSGVQHMAFKLGEGERVGPGQVVLTCTGNARIILALERLLLDLLAHLSGIATTTARVVARVAAANPDCEVAATRKTGPGLRVLEKAAVVAGGGVAHRIGLYDAFLVKDNHLSLQEGTPAERVDLVVRACRRHDPDLLLEVEADTEEQALVAAGVGVDWLLLDNFDPERLARFVPVLRREHPGAKLELSGGITPENVARYAPWGDRVSLGWLTQSAPAIPMSLHVEAV